VSEFVLVDPRHLVQLYTIVEVGSFVAAAERLGLTQPGLSRNIRILEARIGVKLLNRGKHGATPTDEGKVLAAYGRTLRELTQQAAAIGTSVQRGEVGELRIGASFSIANGLIAEPVSRFLAHRPKASVRVIPGPTPQLLQELDTGQLDLVVGGTQLVAEQHGIRFEPLIENQLVVIGRRDHPLSGLDPVPAAALMAARWIVCSQHDPLRVDVESGMTSLGLSRESVALETGSTSLVVDVLTQTDFLTLMPSGFASSLMADRKISRLKLASKFTLRPIGVAYRSNGDIPPVALAFMKMLREWAKTNARALTGETTRIEELSRGQSARIARI
jgi:LysR family transcriptional regulator, pca operon transcriptional activator